MTSKFLKPLLVSMLAASAMTSAGFAQDGSSNEKSFFRSNLPSVLILTPSTEGGSTPTAIVIDEIGDMAVRLGQPVLIPVLAGGSIGYSVSAAGLPDGVSPNGTAISGNAFEAGDFTPTVTVTLGGKSDDETFAMTVYDLLSTDVANATTEEDAGNPISIQPSIIGKAGTLAWEFVPPSYTLPTGLTLDTATGKISGTSTTAVELKDLVLKVKDSFDQATDVTDAFTIKFITALSEYWSSNFNGYQDTQGYENAVSTDGSVYLGGKLTGTAPNYGSEGLAAKYDKKGNVLWMKSVDNTLSSRNTLFYSTAAAGTDAVFAGVTKLNGKSDTDIIVAKFNAAGNLVWATTLGGTGSDRADSVTVGGDGSIYIAGATTIAGKGFDMLVAKISSSGEKIWHKAIGGPSPDQALSVAVGGGAVYLTGFGVPTNVTSNDAVLIKYLEDGTFQWDRTIFSGNSDERGTAVAIGPAGVYMAGQIAVPGRNSDLLMAKFSTAGVFGFKTVWGDTLNETPEQMVMEADGPIVVGQTNGTGLDGLVVKFNSIGVVQWHRTLGGSGTDLFYGASLAGNDMYLSGQASTASDGTDTFLVKLPKDGSKTPVAGSPFTYAGSSRHAYSVSTGDGGFGHAEAAPPITVNVTPALSVLDVSSSGTSTRREFK